MKFNPKATPPKLSGSTPRTREEHLAVFRWQREIGMFEGMGLSEAELDAIENSIEGGDDGTDTWATDSVSLVDASCAVRKSEVIWYDSKKETWQDRKKADSSDGE